LKLFGNDPMERLTEGFDRLADDADVELAL
jgi:hypothetical protein